MSRQTNVKARTPHGDELSFQTTTTDAPALPVAQIAEICKVAPDRLGWVFDETAREADFRRSETKRTNTFKFWTHIVTLFVTAVVVLCGLAATAYCAAIDQTAIGVALATTTVGGLAGVFIAANRSNGQRQGPKQSI